MNRQIALQNIASFLIFLIITLPIHSAGALAATIDSVQVYGAKNVPGFIGVVDTPTINVSVTSPEDQSLSSNQVKILKQPELSFQCASAGEPTRFNCIHEFPETSIYPETGIEMFTVQVFGDSGLPISVPKRASLMVDFLPPEIIQIPEYKVTGDDKLEAHFIVEDKACIAEECEKKCSGIGKVSFSVAGTKLAENSSFGSDCRQEGWLNLSGLVVEGSVGEKHICMEVQDKFGAKTDHCENVFIDAKKPEIESIGLFDKSGRQLKYVNALPSSLYHIEFVIKEHSGIFHPLGDENKILVDASQISERPDYQQLFKSITANCELIEETTQENTYRCSTPNLLLTMSSARSISIGVKAEDSYGNKLDETHPLGLSFDNIPPRVSAIYSNYRNDKDQLFISEKPTVISMDIIESESGMADRIVFLDLSALGTQNVTNTSVKLIHPNECSEGWVCNWYNIRVSTDQRVSGDVVSITPKAGSMDAAGNPFAAPIPIQIFTVDKDAPDVSPELRAISNITGIGEGHPPMTNLSSGDALEIRLFVKDHSGIKKATADLSNMIIDGPKELEGTCVPNQINLSEPQRIFECVWETDAIRPGYISDLDINFTFEDYAGHSGTYIWDGIEILARENETDPHWKITIPEDGISPSIGVDRLSWGLMSQRMYYRMTFTKLSGVEAVTDISFNPTDCGSGLQWVNVDPDTGNFLMNFKGFADFTAPSTKDIFVIELNPGAVPGYYITDDEGSNHSVDSVWVNCTFTMQSIVSRGQERSLSLPQPINVSFEIPVYNNKLGLNIGNVKDKIAAEEDDVKNGLWIFIKYTNTIFNYAKEMCRFVDMLIKLLMIYAGVKDIFSATCAVPAAGQISGACPDALKTGESVSAMQSATDGWLGEVYFMCSLFISCRISKNAKAAMEAQCLDPKDKFCNVKKTWARINNLWAEATGVNYLEKLQKKSGVFGSVEYKVTYADENKNGAPVTKTIKEGATIFSTDDLDPSRSMFSSLASGCLPGVVSNVNKLRQIKCQRLLCMKIDVAEGRPIWQCDKQYDYNICTYWTGQAFAAIPYFQYIDQVGNLIMNIVKKPLSFALGLAIGKGCSLGLCKTLAFGCSACLLLGYAGTVLNLGKDLLENTEDRFGNLDFDLCEEALKDDPSYDFLGLETGGGESSG